VTRHPRRPVPVFVICRRFRRPDDLCHQRRTSGFSLLVIGAVLQHIL